MSVMSSFSDQPAMPVSSWATRPEMIALEPRDDAAPSDQPPVRIFVGTEPSQYRAERVFVWSIEQVRDPGRRYEIYLMSEMPGFDRRRWLTGFTNYRFSIPHLAGGSGRAIYNDVDQLYLVDPALLFDTDMGPHGFMSINDHDTSVMLIDCERMIGVWSLAEVQTGKRKAIEEKARAVPNLWGRIDGGWNARDEEYDPATSKCVHFTTIHTQPWLPFPQRYVYQRNPIAHVFEDREQAADAAGFELFTRDTPSREYSALVAQLRAARAAARSDVGSPARAAKKESESRLVYSFAGVSTPSARPGLNGGGPQLVRYDPTDASTQLPAGGRFEVVVGEGIDLVPSRDVPWVLRELFDRAAGEVQCAVASEARTLSLPGGTTLTSRPRAASWWQEQFERAARRRPEVRWTLNVAGAGGARRFAGGRPLRPPKVWVLQDEKTGHTVQSVGLAQALGWPYEVKELHFNILNRLSNHFLDGSLVSLHAAQSSPLTPPWPEVVISTGRKAAPIARWIAAQSHGRTRLVHLGRKGGEVADDFDLVVSCAHFRMPQHRQRIEIAAPLNTLEGEKLRAARERWQALFEGAPKPWIVLVVGGSTAIHHLDPALAERIGRETAQFAEQAGGRVFAITSPRTGEQATEALARGLGERHHLHRWRPNEAENPYFGYLALADAIVVTGESESMLSEACRVGAPVYIYPIPERPVGLRQRAREWVTQRAYARPRKKRKGTVRPQQGIERWCAQLIAHGWIRPPRDLRELHRALIASGAAHWFGAPLTLEGHPGVHEIDVIAARVRAMFGGLGPGEQRRDIAADANASAAANDGSGELRSNEPLAPLSAAEHRG